MIKTIKELLIEWWAGNSRMYVHYKARTKYPKAKYIQVINQTKTY